METGLDPSGNVYDLDNAELVATLSRQSNREEDAQRLAEYLMARGCETEKRVLQDLALRSSEFARDPQGRIYNAADLDVRNVLKRALPEHLEQDAAALTDWLGAEAKRVREQLVRSGSLLSPEQAARLEMQDAAARAAL